MSESLVYRGSLAGHRGWVTAVATSSENPDMLLTASRDKTLILWQLNRDDESYGYPKRILAGHNHFVSDVVISSDGQFALSSVSTQISSFNTLVIAVLLMALFAFSLPLRAVVGQDSPTLGLEHRCYHPPIRWTHFGRSLRQLLC